MRVHTRPRPNSVLKIVLRLPVYLHRHRLGWLFGDRLLLLAPCGRKSGRVHKTVLEVIRYEPNNQESIVVSAWGERANWHRNLRSSPAREILSGRERYLPAQRFLTPEGAYAEIGAYERRHSWLACVISRWLGYPLDGTQVARRAFASSVHVVAFSPRSR